ncbi:MAG: hypothetical protein HXX11_13275 [Desulfuromonadales bacterium]|nr:hypothetical protein [Desulfuromonadales bacterium]
MKKLILLLFLVVTVVVTSSLHAVTYPFPENEPAYLKEEAVMKVGTKLYLFQSGTQDVKKSIHVNDILVVYREYPPNLSLETRVTGKIKIISCRGKYFYEAEVIEGEVHPNDLAIKGSAAFIITAFKDNGRQQ